jgi:CheY-like chemotaxis protein
MKTVLLVEDNDDDVFFMEIAIQKRKLGCNLRVARNGQEAIDYLHGKGAYANRTAFPMPSIVVTDIHMPLKTGHEVLQWVREHATLRRLPVLMLSSSDLDQDIDLAYDHGANTYLLKPSNHEQMEETVGRAINYWLQTNIPPRMND